MADELKNADREGLLAECVAGGPSVRELALLCEATGPERGCVVRCAAGGPSVHELALLCEAMGPERWRVVSDAAQVVANFLACHPFVAEVRYPGLRVDPSYQEASCVLRAGFGPEVHLRLVGEAGWLRFLASDEPAAAQVLALEEALRAEK